MFWIVLYHSYLQTEEDTTSVKKEEPEEKTETMEVEEKKLEMKTEPKEEDDGGANSTTSSSPSQSRRKSEFISKKKSQEKWTAHFVSAGSQQFPVWDIVGAGVKYDVIRWWLHCNFFDSLILLRVKILLWVKIKI